MIQNLIAGWSLMVLGVLIGMTIGIWAHDDAWANGYPSYRRRMLRLSHVAAFALGIINVLYVFCGEWAALPPWLFYAGSWAMILGGTLMPLACLLASWKKPLRVFFPVPAVLLLVAISVMCFGLWRSGI